MMKRFLLSVVTALLLVVFVVPSHSAQALTISPPTYDFVEDPGATEPGVLKIYNEDTFPVTFYPVVMNFTFGDENGTPQLYPATEDRGGTEMGKWFTMNAPESITLQPQGRATISFSIQVPENAQPGGHYGAIVLSTTPLNQIASHGVGVGAQLGALFLLRVNGDVHEAGSIAEFGLVHPKPWHNYLPIDMFLRFENAGNTHLRPAGNVFIKNMFGQQVAAIKTNEVQGSVLPKSIRKYLFGWSKAVNADTDSELAKEWKNFGFGRYTATLVMSYGQTNQLATDSLVFYVWPWRIMLIVVLSVVALWLFMRYMKRRYDHGVISRYEKQKMVS